MTEVEELEAPAHGKSIGDLGNEALRFAMHTAIAVVTLVLLVVVMQVLHTDPSSNVPKYIATLLAILLPMVVGFAVARARHDEVARYVWIAGLIFFTIVCVTVLDLPTGPGLCEHCGALEKLSRTFFSFDHGSGLMGGDGPLIGYAVGARFGLGE